MSATRDGGTNRDEPRSVADAPSKNWVDRFAPEALKPYLRLARADRPIGVWLLLWPCWWSLALAAIQASEPFPDWRNLALFAIGAIVMRAAGCTYNDIVDRDYDARVERTRLRPIPSGQISVPQAQIFMVALSLIGLLVLLRFNTFTVMLGTSSLAIIALYPFMKRFTDWPQAVLGLVFSWGALMGWAAIFGEITWPPLLLYAGTAAWTIGYDTIYAHQDKEDDQLLGLRSTALKFGDATQAWLWLFYGLALAGFFTAGLAAGAGVVFAAGMSATAAQLVWQIKTLDTDDAENCLKRFRSNRELGALVFVSIAADALVAAWM